MPPEWRRPPGLRTEFTRTFQSPALPHRATQRAPEVLQPLFTASAALMFLGIAGGLARSFGDQIPGAAPVTTPCAARSLSTLDGPLRAMLVLPCPREFHPYSAETSATFDESHLSRIENWPADELGLLFAKLECVSQLKPEDCS